MTRFGAALSLSLGVACAAPLAVDEPVLVDGDPWLLTLVPEYAEPAFPLIDRPSELEVLLFLPAADGPDARSGAIGPHQEGSALLDAVEATVEGTQVSLAPGALRIQRRGNGRLRWTSFTIDRATGEGTIVGHWVQSDRDVVDQSDVTYTVRAAVDRLGGTAFLEAPVARGSRPSVWDPLTLSMNEPMRETSLEEVQILADGVPLVGELAAQGAIGGWVPSATFTPTAPMPFGAVLTVDLNGAVDSAGLPFELRPRALQVIDDPGSLLNNPSFEDGLEGWFHSGRVRVEGRFGGVAPADGVAQAIVAEESSLGGYFDVPSDASELELWATAFSEVGEYDRDRSAVIRLQAGSDDLVTVLDFSEHVDAGETIDLPEIPLGHRIGPLEASADLEPFRGRRVYLTVEARAANFIGVNFYALLVDAIVVRREVSPPPAL